VDEAPERQVGRVGAGGEEQPQERVDLFVAEAFALDLGADERRDQVVPRLAAARREQRRQVGGELRRGRERALRIPRVADQRQRPALEVRFVVGGDSEHAGDDGQGKLSVELRHEVGRAPVREAVDQAVAERPEQLLHRVRHELASKGGRNQRALHAVLLALHAHEVAAHHREGVGLLGRPRREDLLLAERLDDIRVTRDHERDPAVEAHRSDGPILPQLGHEFVEVRDLAAGQGEQGEVDLRVNGANRRHRPLLSATALQ
jgi:hypothetical protein